MTRLQIVLAAAVAASLGLRAGPGIAAGDLAIKAKKIALELGGGEDGFGNSNPTIELESGKAYTLEISEVGPHGCEWEAEEFTRTIWIRQIEVGHTTISTPALEGFDLDDDAEVDLTFVPIRAGEYEWSCEGLGEKGLEGTFIVK